MLIARLECLSEVTLHRCRRPGLRLTTEDSHRQADVDPHLLLILGLCMR